MKPKKKNPAAVQPKVWTIEEVNVAIPKIEHRIIELQSLASDKVRHDDAQVQNVRDNISTTIMEIFGSESGEYAEFRNVEIYHGDSYIADWNEDTDYEDQKNFEAGIPYTKTRLENLIRRLEEKRLDIDSLSTAHLAKSKYCPTCKRTYAESMNFCLEDGTGLLSAGNDSSAETLRMYSDS